jgi:hypothetical protein
MRFLLAAFGITGALFLVVFCIVLKVNQANTYPMTASSKMPTTIQSDDDEDDQKEESITVDDQLGPYVKHS